MWPRGARNAAYDEPTPMCLPNAETPDITPAIASSQIPPTAMVRERRLRSVWKNPLSNPAVASVTLVDPTRGPAALVEAAEDAQAVQGPTDHPGRNQRRDVDRLRRVDPLGVDPTLQVADIDLVPFLAIELVEAAFRQTAMQWHLAAFEAADPDAGTCGLALATATGLLAQPRADAATDPDPLLAGAGIVLDIIEAHGKLVIGEW